MDKIFGYVYVLHNINNSKKYVGKTNNWKVRKTTHMRTLQNGTHWNNRIKKECNGEKSAHLSFHIVYAAKSEQELNLKEIYFIDRWKTLNPKYGYNVAKGGDNNFTKSIVQYTLEGDFVAMHSSVGQAVKAIDTTYKNMWDAVHKVKPATKGYQWFYYSDVGDNLRVLKVEPRMVHRKDINMRKVYCYYLSGLLYKVYESAKQAAEEVRKELRSTNTVKNVQAAIVKQCDNGTERRSSAFGCQWLWEEQDVLAWDPNKERLKGIRPEIHK